MNVCFFLLVVIVPALSNTLNLTASSLLRNLSINDILQLRQHDYYATLERAEMASYDNRFLRYAEVANFKYNRTHFAMNVTLEFKIAIGRELEIVLQAYRFASNEYRLFPLRFETNFCKAFEDDFAGLKGVSKCGNFTSCTFLKNKKVQTCNFIPDESKLPPHIPSGRYRMEFKGYYSSQELTTLNVYMDIRRPEI